MMTREWFSPAELAALALPGMPATKPNVIALAERLDWQRAEWQGTRWRERAGRGGGIEYHYSALPHAAQIRLAVDQTDIEATNEHDALKREKTREEMWRWFDRLPAPKQSVARSRLEALLAVQALVQSGLRKTFIMQQVAVKFGVTLASLYNWERQIYGVDRHDWLPFLAPRHAGRTETVACDPAAWDMLRSDYMRLEKPAFVDCYRRLERAAAAAGWTIPAARTLQRRIEALPEGLRVLAREGTEAAARLYPAQRRDRGVFHALEAVNADGHVWDVFVRWPDGTIGRPLMCAFQDLFSGMILSWRVDRSANREVVRLAFGDLVGTYGIPNHCWLDNGRDFASKWLTGGTPNRYRFKVRDDEPSGIMTMLGIEVHWTTPYHGQSKPIERAFRDMAGGVAKHPRFAGAYVGNNPMAKPENYGSAAVPIEVFLATLQEEILAHNARTGRKAATCQGRSFLETFNAGYADAPIRKATAEQRRLWLLAAEAIGAAKADGHLELFGNRYWSEFLLGHRGDKLTVRFDPQALRRDLQVYRMDGGYLGAAACIADTGFNDADAAQEHRRNHNRFMRAQKQMLAAERRLTPAQVAGLLPAAKEPVLPPESKVVRLVRGGALPVAAPEADEIEMQEREDRIFAGVGAVARAARESRPALRVVTDD